MDVDSDEQADVHSVAYASFEHSEQLLMGLPCYQPSPWPATYRASWRTSPSCGER
jgi:hypothetical protein